MGRRANKLRPRAGDPLPIRGTAVSGLRVHVLRVGILAFANVV